MKLAEAGLSEHFSEKLGGKLGVDEHNFLKRGVSVEQAEGELWKIGGS